MGLVLPTTHMKVGEGKSNWLYVQTVAALGAGVLAGVRAGVWAEVQTVAALGAGVRAGVRAGVQAWVWAGVQTMATSSAGSQTSTKALTQGTSSRRKQSTAHQGVGLAGTGAGPGTGGECVSLPALPCGTVHVHVAGNEHVYPDVLGTLGDGGLL